MWLRSSTTGNKKTAPPAGKRRSTRSTKAGNRGGAGKKTAPATGRKSGKVISSRQRKANAENFKKTSIAKKHAIRKSTKKQAGQLFISLAESKECDIVQVRLCRDDNNELRPCFVVTNAGDVIEGIETANPTLRLDNYGRHKGSGPPSSEAKLNALLLVHGFWELSSKSLIHWEEKPPRDFEWEKLVSHPLLSMEYYDEKTGTFNEERVAEITTATRRKLKNLKNHPNPFKEKAKLLNGNKPKVGNERAVISWTDSKKNRHTITLKSGLTKKEKEALKADAWKAIEEIEGKNPHITKEKLMEELKVRNIKSKRQPSAALENPKRAPKKAETKKEPNAPKPKPKRNQNAFHLYKDATYDDIKASQPDLTYVETINVISANYKALPAAERAYWDVKAAADKTRYFTELAAYEGEAYSVSEKKVAPEKKAAPKKMAAEKAVTKTKKDAPKKKSVTKKAAAPGNLPVATKKRKANKK